MRDYKAMDGTKQWVQERPWSVKYEGYVWLAIISLITGLGLPL